MSASTPASTAESSPTDRGLALGHCFVGQLSCAAPLEVTPNERIARNRIAKRMACLRSGCSTWKRVISTSLDVPAQPKYSIRASLKTIRFREGRHVQAMVLEAPRHPLREVTLPDPVPGPGQILLSVRACGVCRTDLHVADGELPRPKLPLVLGHEIVGTVLALGPG